MRRAAGGGEVFLSARSHRRVALATSALLQPYQSELCKAFERAALRAGFDVIIVVGRGLSHQDPSECAQNASYDWLTPRSVDGVALLSSTLMNFQGKGPLEALIERLGPLPKVSIGAEFPGVPSVTVDNRAGMRAAVDHLIEAHDCRRIGYIAGPSDNQEAQARLEGYRYALEARFLPFDAQLVEPSAFTIEGGATAMRSLLQRGRLFDAIVAANDAMAVGAARVLSERGLTAPGRVRLLGFDDSPVAVSAALSSVAQPFNQLGLHAVEALRGAMQGHSAQHIAFCPRLARRHSCGCRAGAAFGELPPLRKRQSVREYLMAHRATLTERLLDLHSACFDWWSTRVERLLGALDAAAAGNEPEFLRSIDTLVTEAFEDGVPVEQIGHSITRLQQHFEGYGQQVSLDRMWGRTLERIVVTLGNMERKRRTDGMQHLSALRDFAASLWDVEDEQKLARRLAEDLPRMGVQRAYLGLLDTPEDQCFQPCMQLQAPGAVQLGGPAHDVRQLFPDGFPASSPATLLVSAVTGGRHVTGIWACDGSCDPFIFEQLRTCIGGVLARLSRDASRHEPASAVLTRPGVEVAPPPESTHRPVGGRSLARAGDGPASAEVELQHGRSDV